MRKQDESFQLPALTNDEWDELGAEMLSLHFMDTVKKAFSQPFKNKDLALVLKKSPAYVSQLCSGSRLLNMKALQAIQKGQKVNFDLVIRHDVGHPNFKQSMLVSGSQFLVVQPKSQQQPELQEQA